MKASERLSSALGIKNENPNKLLASEIAKNKDLEAIEELAGVLKKPPNLFLLGDVLKTFEEIGKIDASLLKDFGQPIFQYLDHAENKIQWRAMSALSTVAHYCQDEIFHQLSRILEIMDRGSVITRDHGFQILVVLYQNPNYTSEITPLIKEQILASPDNQLGQYAEKWFHVIQQDELANLGKILEDRFEDLDSPSHQKRISKLLKKINKLKSNG